jgi:hypothetical protein
MKTDLPNLLTAASILLAVITALYGLFFPAIKSVLDIEPKKHKADNKQAFINSKVIAKSKYLPLLFGAVIITLIYLPELYRQLKDSLTTLKTNEIENISYDTLTASFIAVCFFMIFITIFIIISGFKLNKKIKDLNPK